MSHIPEKVINDLRIKARAAAPNVFALCLSSPDVWVLVNVSQDPLPDGCVPQVLACEPEGTLLIADYDLLTTQYGFRVVRQVHGVFKLRDNKALRQLARPCWPKECHATLGAAEAQARSLTRRGLQKSSRLHVYRCEHCGWFHVGH